MFLPSNELNVTLVPFRKSTLGVPVAVITVSSSTALLNFISTSLALIAQNDLFLCIRKSPEPHLNQRFRAFLYS
jgi:hypothetical protein